MDILELKPQNKQVSSGDPCPVCASGRVGRSGYNYRCSNCGWLGPRVAWAPVITAGYPLPRLGHQDPPGYRGLPGKCSIDLGSL
jgi:ribosomal protein L37AE/L43A